MELAIPGVMRARALHASATTDWCSFGFEVVRGRLVELSGPASLTRAAGVVLEAQEAREPVAWIGGRTSGFYPPDMAEFGIDLAALAVIRLLRLEAAGTVADKLLRSGGFGLIVLDLGRTPHLPLAIQSRLAKLAERHAAGVLCLTEVPKTRRSLGPLVSLRGWATAERDGRRFLCHVTAVRDRRRTAGWKHTEEYRAPDGLY